MKDKLIKSLELLLREFINEKLNDKHEKIYVGKVVDNNDPKKLSRCKIRVYGIFGEEIPDEDLPWSIAENSFVGSNINSVIIPTINTLVRVYFDNGDIYTPIYTTKVFDKKNISDEADEDYPDTMLFFETDDGEYFKINRKTHTTTYRTASGVLMSIDKDGNLEVYTESSKTGNITFNGPGGTKLEMTKTGVKINDKYIVTEKFLDWIQGAISNFGLGNMGAPVPIFPVNATKLVNGIMNPDNFKTNKIGV